jgi:hypothetical protein
MMTSTGPKILARQGVAGLHAQNGRLHEIALVEGRALRAAGHQFGAFARPLLDEAQHAVALGGADQGPSLLASSRLGPMTKRAIAAWARALTSS